MDTAKDILNEVLSKKVNTKAEKFVSASDLIIEKTGTNYAKSYLTVGEPISDYYYSIHGNVSANPSRQSSIDALNAIYVKYAADIDPNRSDIINSPKGLKSFCELLSYSNTVKTVFIKGPRGTGKTTLLNYLANNYTRILENKSKILWFRVDVTKIYDEWKVLDANIDHSKKISLRDYLAIQVPFVVTKYQDESDAFRDISKKTFVRKVLRNIDNSFKTNKNNFTKYHVRDLLRKDDGSISFQPFEHIINCASNLGYKICIVIDGIDNIDFRLFREDYEKFLVQFVDIFQSGRKESFIDKYIVSVRHETYDHLKLRKPPFFAKNSYKCFHVMPVSIPELLSKKAEIARNPVGNFSQLKNEEKINKHILERMEEEIYLKKLDSHSKFDESFINYSKNYVDKLISSLDKTFPFENKINSYKKILDYIASGNIRDFIINFVNSWRMWLLFEKYEREVPEAARFLEALLLNGRNYVQSSAQVSEAPEGYLFPNIFWFNTNESEGIWHGLCGLRILQYIDSPYSSEKEKLTQGCIPSAQVGQNNLIA